MAAPNHPLIAELQRAFFFKFPFNAIGKLAEVLVTHYCNRSTQLDGQLTGFTAENSGFIGLNLSSNTFSNSPYVFFLLKLHLYCVL